MTLRSILARGRPGPVWAGLVITALLPACTAVAVSPPLSPQHGRGRPVGDAGYVQLCSGEAQQPHRVTGVIQMTQTGYKWMHEVEVVDDANPSSILFKVAAYAHENGADGVQHLSLIDLDPQTPGETVGKQLDSAVRIAEAVQHGHPEQAAREGTKTRWEVQGELVVFSQD